MPSQVSAIRLWYSILHDEKVRKGRNKVRGLNSLSPVSFELAESKLESIIILLLCACRLYSAPGGTQRGTPWHKIRCKNAFNPNKLKLKIKN